MGETKLVVDTNLGFYEYISVVNKIAEKFFDEDGTYAPHLGRINALCVFYNYCVTEDNFDVQIPEGDDKNTFVELLAKDEAFMREFNNAIKTDENYGLNFANAYWDAADIVYSRRTSVNNAVEVVKKAILNLAEKAASLFNDENVGKFTEIAKQISNGNLNADTIIDAYVNSQTATETVNKE